MEKGKRYTKKQGILFLLIVFAASIVVFGIIFSGNSTAKTNANPASVTITKTEFDKIENGMTYDQVKNIIGGDGELQVESGEKGSELYTVAYKWNGEGTIGANASFTFQGSTPKLQMKAQAGLK